MRPPPIPMPTPAPDDPDSAGPDRLLRLARAGSQTALGQLLEGYRPYLALLARLGIGRRLQAKVDAADVVQETLLKAHRDFAAFRGGTEGELTAWLRQVLVWTLANQVRRYQGARGRDPRLEVELRAVADGSVLSGGLIDPGTSPSGRAARREGGVLLADALGTLPAHYREAVVLRHLEGLSFPQVAERMGRSEESVKKLWARGLALLKKTLGGDP